MNNESALKLQQADPAGDEAFNSWSRSKVTWVAVAIGLAAISFMLMMFVTLSGGIEMFSGMAAESLAPAMGQGNSRQHMPGNGNDGATNDGESRVRVPGL